MLMIDNHRCFLMCWILNQGEHAGRKKHATSPSLWAGTIKFKDSYLHKECLWFEMDSGGVNSVHWTPGWRQKVWVTFCVPKAWRKLSGETLCFFLSYIFLWFITFSLQWISNVISYFPFWDNSYIVPPWEISLDCYGNTKHFIFQVHNIKPIFLPCKN